MKGILLLPAVLISISSAEYLTHNGVEYGTVKSLKTGKIWLDRNLGAKRVCTKPFDKLCYGDYYQWGRGADGHQKVGSNSFVTKSKDWSSQSYQTRNNFWSRTDGSGICPVGFRVPTDAEFKAEFDNDMSSPGNLNWTFRQILKLPLAGARYYRDVIEWSSPDFYAGEVYEEITDGYYWSVSPSKSAAWGMRHMWCSSQIGHYDRAYGFSVRCIKD